MISRNIKLEKFGKIISGDFDIGMYIYIREKKNNFRVLCYDNPNSQDEAFDYWFLNQQELLDHIAGSNWEIEWIENGIEKFTNLTIKDGRVFCTTEYSNHQCNNSLEDITGILHLRDYSLPHDASIWNLLLPDPQYEYSSLIPPNYEECPCCEGKAVEVKIRIYEDLICWEFIPPSTPVSLIFNRKQYEDELSKISAPPEGFVTKLTREDFYTVNDILDSCRGQKITQVDITNGDQCIIEFANDIKLVLNSSGEIEWKIYKNITEQEKGLSSLRANIQNARLIRYEYSNDMDKLILHFGENYKLIFRIINFNTYKDMDIYRYWDGDDVDFIEMPFGKIYYK